MPRRKVTANTSAPPKNNAKPPADTTAPPADTTPPASTQGDNPPAATNTTAQGKHVRARVLVDGHAGKSNTICKASAEQIAEWEKHGLVDSSKAAVAAIEKGLAGNDEAAPDQEQILE